MDRNTVYPSARVCLEAHIGCREAFPQGHRGWALYWSEGGAELTLYPGDEGPQEMDDIEHALECIGGDQPVKLNPGTIKYIESLELMDRVDLLTRIACDNRTVYL